MTTADDLCADLIDAINARLDVLTAPAPGTPNPLSDAIRAATLSRGKRLRPLLTVLIANSDGQERSAALDIGCAGEMVHAASLILDDLPCMDDAQTRRGAPCVHVAHNQATAILAATALLNRAFGVIVEADGAASEHKTEIVGLLSSAIGETGLIGGQFHDLHPPENADRGAILATYARKTGALFEYAILSGATLCDMPPAGRAALKVVSRHLGLAFQIHDDLIDQTASPSEALKDVGQDERRATYISASSDRDLGAGIRRRKDTALEALSRSGLAADALSQVVARQFDLAIARAR